MACNKELTKNAWYGFNSSKGSICVDEEDLAETINKIGYPIVLKPLDGNHGKGASINVTNWEDAVSGLAFAKEYSKRVIVEKFITGFDFRILVIDNKLVAAKRVPAHVIGKKFNSRINCHWKPRSKRGYGHENVLQIDVNRDTEDLLKKLNYTLETIPEMGVYKIYS
jgi:cyanophycin synthetase